MKGLTKVDQRLLQERCVLVGIVDFPVRKAYPRGFQCVSTLIDRDAAWRTQRAGTLKSLGRNMILSIAYESTNRRGSWIRVLHKSNYKASRSNFFNFRSIPNLHDP
jgi:hypothetical protein